MWFIYPGHLFNKLTDVLLQDLVKSRCHEYRVETFLIALKFDSHLGSSAVDPVVNRGLGSSELIYWHRDKTLFCCGYIIHFNVFIFRYWFFINLHDCPLPAKQKERTWWRHVIKWIHCQCYGPFVRRIHRLPVDSPHEARCRESLIFCLIGTWTNGWANNQDAGDLRRHCVHYGVAVVEFWVKINNNKLQEKQQIANHVHNLMLPCGVTEMTTNLTYFRQWLFPISSNNV